MNLDLETIVPRTRGRAAAPLTVEVLRPATIEDAQARGEEQATKAPLITRLSDRHHALARTLAAGQSEGQAAAICGYSLSRVSILKADPTFRELIEFYRSQEDRIFRGVAEKLTGIASAALDELEERLEETPEDFSVGQLLEVVKTGADRTGFGPTSTQTSVNINIGLAEKMEAARRRALEASKVIEALPAGDDA